MNSPSRMRGFTLLEVLVALVIVAFGMGALMATLTSAATSVERLRDKSFAEWVALNRISEVRLGRAAMTKGKTNGESELAGQKWQWTQEIADANFPNLLRIEVRVARKGAKAGEVTDALAQAEGYAGLAGTLARNIGDFTDADWSMETAKSLAPPPAGGNPSQPGSSPAPNTPAPQRIPPTPPLSNPASSQ